jgi:hypothetical protein
MGRRRLGRPSDYSGMTTNERLFAAGLMDEFDQSVLGGDRKAMIRLLTAVDLGDQAARIADTILSHPTRYGYPRRQVKAARH